MFASPRNPGSSLHLRAWSQLKMPFDVPAGQTLRVEDMPPSQHRETAKETIVSSKDFSLVFDREKGHFVSFRYVGSELVKKGPSLNFWRAPTDNDAARMAVE
jgi:hypothetical protein